MKHTVGIFAEYNRHANEQLFDVLDEQSDELLNRPAGAYFGSIVGILNHILLSNLGWLTRFRDGGARTSALGHDRLVYDDPGFGNLLYDDYPSVKECQKEVDAIFVAFVRELDEDSVVEYDRRGEHMRYRTAEILLHLFNHATHHRGQISQVLDSSGVDHDYSNLHPILDQV